MSNNLKKGAAAMALVIAVTVPVLKQLEGERMVSYRDTVGRWTACVGETQGIGPNMRFTEAQCAKMLADHLPVYYNGMVACLTNPDAIPVRTRAAFLSVTYNIGVRGFCKSSIAAAANAGNIRVACERIMRFLKPPELKGRRLKERSLCLSGLQ